MNQFLSIEQKVECLRQEVGNLKGQLQTFMEVGLASLESAMTEARKIMEFVLGKIMLAEGLTVDRELMNNIEILGGKDPKLSARRRKEPQGPIPPPILPAQIYSSLHNLRIYGNLVTHPWDPTTMELKDVRISSLDLQVALGQIMRLIEWYFIEYPKGPGYDPLYAGLPEPTIGSYSDAPPNVTAFIGRVSELTQLRQLLQQGPRLITVLAAAGMGKTMLAARAALDVAASWRAGQGLLLWMDLKGAPSFGEVSARLLASLQTDAKPTDHEIVQQSPLARIALIVRRMAERPVLLVLDNVESWLDPETRAPQDPYVAQLLVQLGTRAHKGRVLLTSRAEVEVMGVPASETESLRLGMLPLADAGSLLLSQGIKGSEAGVHSTWKRLGGNPRMLLMLAEVLLKRRCRDLDQGISRFPALVGGAADGLLAEVWAELSVEAQQVLQTLAILRPPATAGDIEGVLAQLVPETTALVEDVFWSGLVPRALVAPTAEGDAFTVEHLMIRDYAVRQWPDLQAVHRAAMNHFRQALPPELKPNADSRTHLAVIHHAVAAGEYELAAGVLTSGQFGKEFFRQGRALELRDLCRPLLAVAEQLTPVSRLRVRRMAATCLNDLGDYPAARELLDACRADLGEAQGTRDEALLQREVCSVLRKMQQFDAAEEAGMRALTVAQQLNLLEEQTSAVIELAALERNRGRPGASSRRANEALELADRTSDLRLRAMARSHLARTFLGGANLKPAERLYREALDLCRQSANVATEAQVLGALADIARRQTQNARAIQLVQEALTIAQRIGDRTAEGIVRGCLGLTLLQMGKGRAAEALTELRRSLRIAFDLDHPREVTHGLLHLGRALERSPPLAVAVACYQTAADLHARIDHAGKKERRRLEELRTETESKGGNWAEVEQLVATQRHALLEQASQIEADRWRLFLAECGREARTLAEDLPQGSAE